MLIGALILAAGRSERFGKPKLTAQLTSGKTLIESVVDNLDTVFDDSVVITRSNQNQLVQFLAKRQLAYACIDAPFTLMKASNQRFHPTGSTPSTQHMHTTSTAHTGLGDSIALGASLISSKFVAKEWDACVICLSDMPFIQRKTYQSVYNALREANIDSSSAVQMRDFTIVAPRYHGQRGHPVGFMRSHFDALRQLTGDTGAQHILRSNSAQLRLLDCDDCGVLKDIDYPTDI